MADRPIIFSGPMVRAILDGRKSQTRRLLPRPTDHFHASYTVPIVDRGRVYWTDGARLRRPAPTRYAVGDRLWVREAWRTEARFDKTAPRKIPPGSLVSYEADFNCEPNDGCRGKLRPSIHMPRWASRLTLIVTGVRVERVQSISEADARAEGHPFSHDGRQYDPPPPEVDRWQGYGRASFSLLWSQPHGPGSWEANPWVVALTFTTVPANIDARQEAA